VSRIVDPKPPEGSKAVGGFLVNLLMAEVSVVNFKKLMNFLLNRIGDKSGSLGFTMLIC
jgi:hypothetical protein